MTSAVDPLKTRTASRSIFAPPIPVEQAVAATLVPRALMYLLGVHVVGVFAGSLLMALPLADPSAYRIFMLQLPLWLALAGGAVLIGRSTALGPVDALGLRAAWSDVPLGIFAGFVVHWMVAALYWFISRLSGDLDIEGPARELAAQATDTPQRLLLFAGVAVVAPVVEEMMYRGAIGRIVDAALRGGGAPRWSSHPLARRLVGAAAVAALFAVAHLQGIQLPGLWVIGMALSLLALRTGRIGAAIVAHAVFNAISLMALFGHPIPLTATS